MDKDDEDQHLEVHAHFKRDDSDVKDASNSVEHTGTAMGTENDGQNQSMMMTWEVMNMNSVPMPTPIFVPAVTPIEAANEKTSRRREENVLGSTFRIGYN